ncbi:MAG: tetratricopeptide repeat protein [Pacificimonas sp.]|jgi:tetratricopeptide (TPR) repeat protein|nr:tetratricopeptide repeat protein [Pacificimonas sp.]
MKLIRTLALTAAMSMALPATGAMAQALDRDVGLPLQEAQSLAQRGNTSAAMARVRTARSAADSALERRRVTEMSAYVNTVARNYAAAARDLESIGAPASRLAPLYYQAGNYERAIELGQRMGGTQGNTIVAQSYVRQGNFQAAADLYERLIEQNGPQQNLLENLASAQFKLEQRDEYLETIERLIRLDPTPQRWNRLLNDLKGDLTTRDAQLALYKLIGETNNLNRPEDFIEFAKFATVAEQPGVANRIVTQGLEAGTLSAEDPQVQSIVRASEQGMASAAADFASLKPGPEGYYRMANTFFGAENYRAAAVAYWRSYQQQRDLNSPPYKNQALIGLGVSALRAGDTDLAQKAFQLVDDDSAFNEVAALWALYADTSGA